MNKKSVKFFVITGGPGSGKTAVIDELKKRGVFCIEEAGRKIIQDEMAQGGAALPDANIAQRIEKMCLYSLQTYQEAMKAEGIVLFDRGIFDYLAYASHTNTPISDEIHQASLSVVYNKNVFIMPPWQEIYCHDTERKHSFEEAIEVYLFCRKIYCEKGYEILELPKMGIKARDDFIWKHIQDSLLNDFSSG